MKLEATPISGLYVIHRDVVSDKRGWFSRLFGEDEFLAVGKPTQAVHVNTSTSPEVGTLRGIHFQYPPYSETKIIYCTSGKIWDVAVDLRPQSPTRFRWFGKFLSPEIPNGLLVPEGFGHGFITAEPNSTILYIVSKKYSPEHESGVRFDDPLISIDWPVPPSVISDKDLGWDSLGTRLESINFRLPPFQI